MTRLLTLLLCCTILSLAGCMQRMQNAENLPSMTPPPVDDLQDGGARNPGSLFNPGNADYLFSDNRARRVGDIVIVNIVDVSKGKQYAKTDTKRETYLELGVSTFFNKDETGIDPVGGANVLGLRANTGGDNKGIVNTHTKNKFKGEGTTDRKTDVKATVAVRVVKVLPGGLMQVEGARETRVNEETQVLVVRGLLRPRDIGADNTVESTSLANSSIEYYGKGVLADKQKAGWVMRLLDNVWPF